VTAVQLLNPRPSLQIRIEAKPLECQYIIFQKFSDSVTTWFVARMLVVLLVTGTTVLLICLRLRMESASRLWPERKKKTLTDAEIAQAVADAADAAERGSRSSGIRIGDSHFHLEGRQLGTETTETTEGTEVPMDADTMSVDPPVEASEGIEE
jgi:hypothetical protein